ncbi:recombinase family protein [Streptomyces anthocyanicus]|uniref:recombinase family protein n=1 Tax=Streptomyces anthocyanicus TaxID=68174 RepID=UPI0038632582
MAAPAANHGPAPTRAVRAALMLRVSTQEQVRGYGLGVQEGAGRAYVAVRPGWALSPELIFRDEGVSGATVVRPGMLRLEQAARQGLVDVVVVHSFDRVGRTARSFWAWIWALEDLGVRVVSATEDIDPATESGRHQLQGCVLRAEAERTLLCERTQGGRQRKALDGGWVGGPPPWGYATDKSGGHRSVLVADEGEARVVRRAVSLVVDESLNVSEAARELNASGHLTRSGRPWTASNLHRRLRCSALLEGEVIFRNPAGDGRNRTRLDQNGVPVHGQSVVLAVPRIISEERADELARVLREGGHSSHAAADAYPLTGRILGACGHRYVGSFSKSNVTRYYRCGGGNNGKRRETNCSDPLLDAAAEAAVWKVIEGCLADPRLLSAAQGRLTSHPGDIGKQRERVAHLTAALRKKEEALTHALTTLVLSVPDQAVREAALRQLTHDVHSARALLATGQQVLLGQEAAATAHTTTCLAQAAGGAAHVEVADMTAVIGLLDIMVKPLGEVRKRSGVKCKVTEWHERTGTPVPARVAASEWPVVEELMTTYFACRQFARGTVDIRTQLNGALHRLRTGCLWGELPEGYGPWQLAKERQNAWFRKGFWPVLVEGLNRRGAATPVRREPQVPPLEVTVTVASESVKHDTRSTL